MPLVLFTICWHSPASVQSQLRIDTNDDGFLVSEADHPVLQYQLRTKSLDGKWPRNNYVHPLYDLNGNVITEDFPDDHRHHRGIFWAWHQVWVGDRRLGDPWVCKDFVWNVVSRGSGSLPDGSVTVCSTVNWQSPDFTDGADKMLPVASEYVQMTIHPRTAEYRLIDFDIQLKAIVPDLRIGGSDDVKGYGGFSPRIKLTKTQRFLSPAGEVEPLKTAVSAGPFINIADEKTGLLILQHPSNPRYPQPWILRRAKSMQNAVYPGQNPVEVPMNPPLVLRYRLAVHSGNLTTVPGTVFQPHFEATP